MPAFVRQICKMFVEEKKNLIACTAVVAQEKTESAGVFFVAFFIFWEGEDEGLDSRDAARRVREFQFYFSGRKQTNMIQITLFKISDCASRFFFGTSE